MEINDSNIQKQIEGSDYIFREACSDRYIAEISEFKEQYLYEILSTKFEQAVNDFILIDGNLFGRKRVHVDIYMGKIRERELRPHGSLNQFYEAFLLGFL